MREGRLNELFHYQLSHLDINLGPAAFHLKGNNKLKGRRNRNLQRIEESESAEYFIIRWVEEIQELLEVQDVSEIHKRQLICICESFLAIHFLLFIKYDNWTDNWTTYLAKRLKRESDMKAGSYFYFCHSKWGIKSSPNNPLGKMRC